MGGLKHLGRKINREIKRVQHQTFEGKVNIGDNIYVAPAELQRRLDAEKEQLNQRIQQEQRAIEAENERIRSEQAKAAAMKQESEARMRSLEAEKERIKSEEAKVKAIQQENEAKMRSLQTEKEQLVLRDQRVQEAKKELEAENERIKSEEAKVMAIKEENEAIMRKREEEEKRKELEMEQLFSEKNRILANHPKKMEYFGPESYEVVKTKLGEGGNGHVDLVELKNNRTTIARKILSKSFDSHTEKFEKFLTRECMLFYLEHENIIKFIGHTKVEFYHGILVEYMEGGSLEEIVNPIPKIATTYSLNDVISWNLQSARALEYLHSFEFPYLHRDVKPGNMLLNKDHKVLKLGDFGCAKATADSSNTSMIGTTRYAAPEVLLNQNYREASDVYSWTLTFWQCCTGETPFDYPNSVQISVNKGNSNHLLGMIENASDEFNRMIQLSSAFDPSLRLPMSSIRVLLENLQNSVNSNVGTTIEELKSIQSCVYICNPKTEEFFYSNKTF